MNTEIIEKYFKLPLYFDGITYLFDSNNQMFADLVKNDDKNHVDLLNNVINNKMIVLKNTIIIKEDILYILENPFIRIRAYGYLTGVCNLKENQAEIVQDEMLLYLKSWFEENRIAQETSPTLFENPYLNLIQEGNLLGYSEKYNRRLNSHIDLNKEYNLIKNKKSNLSRWERNKVLKIVEK
jgi:hypothetical protein